ncbi:hypothetical protein [Methanohalophilus sp.]|uniref:DUF7524 family protein n=1 Tax=Methanohalophilus sp. TaxID=1966352 RepID=UPI002606CBE7|nr:hypothetical protein [Methanohalophilus sp.]MDK2892323.1 hypothetical protein [Methanohalophilus sp.]
MQQIHINRLGVNSIEFESPVLNVPLVPGSEDSFELVIINYGSPTHVNLSVDPHLEDYVTFLDDNPYVTHEEYVPVVVRIPYDGKLFNTGNVFVMVGYGSRKDSFTINIGTEKHEIGMIRDEYEDTVFEPPSCKISGTRASSPLLEMAGKSFRAVDMQKLMVLMVGIVVLIAAYLFISSIPHLLGEKGISFGFYPSVFLAIIFTAAAAYLFVRLPFIR